MPDAPTQPSVLLDDAAPDPTGVGPGWDVEWAVRTTATMPGTAIPETKVHPCKSEEKALILAGYYRGHYAKHPALNATVELVSRTVGPWEEAGGDA